MSVPTHSLVPKWIKEPRSYSISGEERALIETARRLGLSHLLQTYNRHGEERPTRELLAILYWRAVRAVSRWFRRPRPIASAPDVREMRDELYQARVANLEEIKATNPEQFREYQHRHGNYLARFAR